MIRGPLHSEEVEPGRFALDVVHWNETLAGCQRCARTGRYIAPYFAPSRRVCPTCCRELERLYDEHGWPPAR